ncbi:MAG: HTH domain-containing protein [Oscillospiraceae bacterium]|nr:HTH domain-containing protein [Oscillospiraceae bacterium]
MYNAIVHNCYMYGTPIQVRIEDEAMIISNRCILPDGWTADTLTEPHDSVPYNPDIANVFCRAGFIENRGRGIETICSACRELGAEQPTYELRGNSLRVRFAALQSAFIADSKAPNGQGDQKDGQKENELETRVPALIAKNNNITMSRIAVRLEVSYKTVQRFMDKLKGAGRIECKGGKRFGYWEIR